MSCIAFGQKTCPRQYSLRSHNEEEEKAKQAWFAQLRPVFCFVLIVVSKRELMAFTDTRYDIQLAESIHDTG